MSRRSPLAEPFHRSPRATFEPFHRSPRRAPRLRLVGPVSARNTVAGAGGLEPPFRDPKSRGLPGSRRPKAPLTLTLSPVGRGNSTSPSPFQGEGRGEG